VSSRAKGHVIDKVKVSVFAVFAFLRTKIFDLEREIL
jgi:hypothetical protein